MATPLDSSRPIRWGVLGAGGIAATVGADIARSPDSEVVAVGARDRERAARLASQLGASRAYGSYRELVADVEVDVVYIATTHAQHHEQALLALRAGKPILVEKAFTLNARQARDVVAAARDAELFCMEAMWLRFNPLIRTAVDLTRDGAIGDLISVHADLSALVPVRPQSPVVRPGRRRRRPPRPGRLSGSFRVAVPGSTGRSPGHRRALPYRIGRHLRAAVGVPGRPVRAIVLHDPRPQPDDCAHSRHRRLDLR